MTEEDFRILIAAEPMPAQTVSVAEIYEGNRTLLYGYTCDRHTWHVYWLDYKIVLHVYNSQGQTIRLLDNSTWTAKDLVPDKRLYPERCDFGMCEALRHARVNLSFTTYNADKMKLKDGPYYGLTGLTSGTAEASTDAKEVSERSIQ